MARFYKISGFFLISLLLGKGLAAQDFSKDLQVLQKMIYTHPEEIVVLRFSGGMDALEENWHVIGLYNKGAYIVRIKEGAQADLKHIGAWKKWNPEDKYDVGILDATRRSGNQFIILLKTISGLPLEDVAQKLSMQGIAMLHKDKWKNRHLYTVSVTKTQLEELAAQYWVLGMEAVTEDEPMNREATSMTQVKYIQQAVAAGGEGLSGEGIIIGVGDEGEPGHIDTRAHLIRQFNPMLSLGHGVHVTTTVAGAGIKDERYKGFAPKADVIGQFYSAVLEYAPALQTDFGMSLTNNSYGTRLGECDFMGRYTLTSQALDEMAFDYPKLLNIFAAGNDGTLTCSPAPTGFRTVAGAYQPSKNTLCVANLGKSIHWFHPTSSKGPVKDGRLKPEITAIGMRVISGGTDNSYYTNTGTSMAAPNVTGAAALLSEKYRALFGELPDAALLKAVLMNGAMDIANPGPDFKYGFGLMDVRQSLSILQSNRFLKAAVTGGSTNNHTITVPANVSRAKVMICWNDPAATPTPFDESIPKLVNDLDMKVNFSSTEILPWVLNPASPNDYAVRATDRINNVEQVTIDDPAPGTYQVAVNGFDITTADQQYILVWDFEMDELNLLFPIGDEALSGSDSMKVYFKNPVTTNSFSCQFSSDAGTTWSTISASIADSLRNIIFLPPAVVSDKCRIRISENGTSRTATSGNFTLSQRPVITAAPDPEQCPGSIKVNWTSVSGTSSYILFIYKGGEMVPVDTVASVLTYTFTGLPVNEEQWLAVSPLIGDKRGIRSVALNKVADRGSCTGSGAPVQDVALLELKAPVSGRIATSASLGANELIKVKLQNRGTSLVNNVTLKAQVNGGTALTQFYSLNLEAGKDTLLSMDDHPIDMAASGMYHIKVFCSPAIADAHAWNDTLIQDVEQIENPLIDPDLGYEESFEGVGETQFTRNKTGIPGARKWDYIKTKGFGRLSGFINSDVAISGTKAMSMDLYRNAMAYPDSQSTNALVSTLNMSGTAVTAKEVRIDFLYRFAGKPKYLYENAVYIRGADTDPWIHVLTLDTVAAASVKQSGYISLNDHLLSHGQHFSTSTQVKIEQKDTSLISGADFGNGLTVDSFRLYSVTNDVSLEDIINPPQQGCGLSETEKVTVAVRNNVFYTLHNIVVHYSLNGGSVVTETIDSIPAKTTIHHTFAPVEDFSALGSYTINAWVVTEEDDFSYNDTLEGYTVRHQPVIIEYPYLESFESGGDHYYTESYSAWEESQPDLPGIKKAANGNIAWNTNRIGSDTTDNVSYLYTPCFDISSLSKPQLSFSLAYSFPDHDSIAAYGFYVEYSLDGKSWDKLGGMGTGHNWYDHDSSIWSMKVRDWTGVTHELPASAPVISFRFVFRSSGGSTNSGVAIDDIHIYDLGKDIFEPGGNVTDEHTITGGGEAVFETPDHMIAAIQSTSATGITSVAQYNHEEVRVTDANEAVFATNFGIQYAQEPEGNASVQLYIPHRSLARMRDAPCTSCFKNTSVYNMGITNFHSADRQLINADLGDNVNGEYTFIPRSSVTYIPYANGYIARFNTGLSGEFWFNDGGATGDQPLNFVPVVLSGQQGSNASALLKWESKIDTIVSLYQLEEYTDTGGFINIFETGSRNEETAFYEHYDSGPFILDGKARYRLKYMTRDGRERYTNEVEIFWDKLGAFSIFPNPVKNGSLNIAWNMNQLTSIQLRIIDVAGRTLYRHQIDPDALIGIYTIDMTQTGVVANGVYILQVIAGEEELARKFVYLR